MMKKSMTDTRLHGGADRGGIVERSATKVSTIKSVKLCGSLAFSQELLVLE